MSEILEEKVMNDFMTMIQSIKRDDISVESKRLMYLNAYIDFCKSCEVLSPIDYKANVSACLNQLDSEIKEMLESTP